MKKDKKKRKKQREKERKRRHARVAPSGRAITRARDAVTRASQALDERLAALQAVADGMDEAAVERFRSLAVKDLHDQRLLRDVADLQGAFARHSEGLPDELEAFRHLPEALLRWMQLRFGLKPHLEAGRMMEVPSEKLDAFEIAGDRGEAPDGVLVRLRVLAPGWKRGSEVVVPPRAEVIPVE
jgi:hypothetical protein